MVLLPDFFKALRHNLIKALEAGAPLSVETVYAQIPMFQPFSKPRKGIWMNVNITRRAQATK